MILFVVGSCEENKIKQNFKKREREMKQTTTLFTKRNKKLVELYFLLLGSSVSNFLDCISFTKKINKKQVRKKVV
jgi:hypothetical protein